MSDALKIKVDADTIVSALWDVPTSSEAALVLAHGAGAGMAHRHMAATASGLVERRVATLRYNFPYMERGSKRPDAPRIAHMAVRAAIDRALELAAGLPVFAGGRSFGARMTSQAQSEAPLPAVRGLVFFAFPLHPTGKPAIDRAAHLDDVGIPMLFLQGGEDELAELALLRPVVAGLGKRATLHVVPHADHAFHVPARSRRNDAQVLGEILDVARTWMSRLAQ